VRVIAKPRLIAFWESRKTTAESRIAERDLSVWYKLALGGDWPNHEAMKDQTFGTADRVGNCTVFDVGNNRYRLIGRINYAAGIIFVLKVMDHAEYDKKAWITDCGCHQPPPKQLAKGKRAPSRPKGGSHHGC
jgi:mRNA interferase HigB